jgi:uncharacterized protein (DUF486 family)
VNLRTGWFAAREDEPEHSRRYDAETTKENNDMPYSLSAYLLPVVLLVGSNLFMTAAWYGHLKYPGKALWVVILASWGIAFFEYCLQVPANRWGHVVYSAPQLKGMQEVITLLVFAGFSAAYLGEPLKWNHWAGFALIVVAAVLIFWE